MFFFFFFQAEDGIRDFHVTGVQTCLFRSGSCWSCSLLIAPLSPLSAFITVNPRSRDAVNHGFRGRRIFRVPQGQNRRSEERRVGKETRYGWSASLLRTRAQ